MSKLLIAGQTDVGKRRTDNQDTFISRPIWADSSALLVVIDGMGSYADGERAAAIARASIERYMLTPNGDPLTMLREAVVLANNQINEARQQNPQLAQMCCVLTAAVADASAGKLYYAHVGDTRLYRYRHNILEKLTADHSLVGIREDTHPLTEVEAIEYPRRIEILRKVGSAAHRVDDPNFLDSNETDFLPGDLLLVCSNGLTDMITHAQITDVLNRSLSLDMQVSGLIKLANKQGGADNITVVLAKNNNQPTEAEQVPDKKAKIGRIMPDTTTRVVIAGSSEPVKMTPYKGKIIAWLLGFILLAVASTLGWYLSNQPGDDTIAEADSVRFIPDSTALALPLANSNRLDSMLQLAHKRADHQLLLTTDTLRISHPIVLTDSVLAIVGKKSPTVLIPSDTAHSSIGIQINSHKTVTLSNLTFIGFKIGVEITGPVQLQLKNVYFRNVGLPIRNDVRQDTFRNAVMNTVVKEPLLLPKRQRNE